MLAVYQGQLWKKKKDKSIVNCYKTASKLLTIFSFLEFKKVQMLLKDHGH